MTIKTFWLLFLKMVGIYLLVCAFSVIPKFFSSVHYINGNDTLEYTIVATAMMLITLLIYVLAVRFFLFDTNLILKTLKLEEGFLEERIDIQVDTSSVLKIVIILLGGVMLTHGLPAFCKELFEFFQKKSVFREYPSSGWLVFHLIRCLIGFLMITNSILVAKKIEEISSKKEKDTTLDN